jgi:hypothetical protein
MKNKDFYNIPSFVSAALGKNIELLLSVDELFGIDRLEFNININSNK